MFGLSLPCQLIQGPAVRTWNCVAHFANLLWYKFNFIKESSMPRSRRRHHSRSRTRSRSRSQSCDRDRETKRRKIDNYESPHKRSDSLEDEEVVMENSSEIEQNKSESTTSDKVIEVHESSSENENTPTIDSKPTSTMVTPKKPLTPKQLQKKLLSEEKKKERDKQKEEKLKILEEKRKMKREELEKKMLEKQKKIEQKQEEQEKKLVDKQKKIEQKQKELEEKQKKKELLEEKKKKEREEKELKRKEKEEKDEQKRKEHIEKQKLVEKKEKAAAAFVNFFKKKSEVQVDDKMKEINNTSTFMPFEVKSDMRLAPIARVVLDETKKLNMCNTLEKQEGCTYLEELRSGKKVGKSGKTWPIVDLNDDIVIFEDVNPGESIEEQCKSTKMKGKFFKFDGNRRPAYFGTWRKKSALIKSRRPFAVDNAYFNYDIDSDEEWEEDDDSGESLRGSDDDKENDSENEYEEDNDFFVPHGHLSDDEIDDEENVSPEAHKAKLKLLKKEFEEEMRSKTQKIKPRVIGCIWYNKEGNNVDSTIDSFLKPLSIISNGAVTSIKRSKFTTPFIVRRSFNRVKELGPEFVPVFLKFVHGSTTNSRALATEFLYSLEKQNMNVDISKASLVRELKKFASWTRCPEGGPTLKKYCWFVHRNFSDEYNVDLP